MRLKIIWVVSINLIYLAITLAVLSKGETRFEHIVISLLVLIYINVNASNTMLSRTILGVGSYIEKEFKHSRKLHHEEIDENDNSVETLLKKGQIEYYINAGFTFLIYLICIFNIVTNL
jgi:hypothetical protein